MIDDDVAIRYERGRNAASSPYRFDLEMPDPEIWFLEDDGVELGVFHSHLSSPPRPSRTDVENVGLWQGRPYLIYTVRTGELAAWRIVNGAIEALPVIIDECGLRAGEAGKETEKSPFMELACGSHWKWYFPACSVIVSFLVPLNETSVDTSTPGPVRWKSWMSAWSSTLRM